MLRNYSRKLGVIALTLGIGLVACAKNAEQNRIEREGSEEALKPAGGLVYAAGWTEITLIANYAKTTVDNAGHFTTSRTACGKESYGVLELDHWNALAYRLNVALKTPPARQELCLAKPDAGRYMDGTTELTAPTPKRLLFESRGAKICTNIADQQLAQDLLNEIHRVITRADKEDCPT